MFLYIKLWGDIMIRSEAVAGQFYEGSFDGLDKQIRNCFEGKLGPAALPTGKRKGRIFGAIVPHAGYEFSGQAAAWAYKAIAEAEQPDLFVIVGVNHRGIGKEIALSLADFSTPLGIVKNDKEFAKAIIKKAKANNKIDIQDEKAHIFEHSIEVQLPFLLFTTKNLKFVPIIISNYSYGLCEMLAKTIADVAKQLRKKICLIASSDFTHYGYSYGFIPFSENVKENLYKLDDGAIDKIKDLDAKSFIDYAQNTTICGAGAIATAIETCKALGSKKAELLKYYTSGDIVKDYSSAVGYAAIIFK